MGFPRWKLPDPMTVSAMVGSGLMMAQMTEAKALRDSVFLTYFPVTALPTITSIAAVFAILSSYGSSRLIRAVSPDRFAPLSFVISGILQIGERTLLMSQPRVAACAIYLHVFAINLLLTSSFWSLMNEHYDPRSAKKAFGKIGGAGTFGGVVGGLVAARVAELGSIPALILVTAVLHLACGSALYWFTSKYKVPHREDRDAGKPPAVVRILKKTPYLLEVASLMIVVSVAASLLDFLFKSQAAAALSRGPALTRFFALFYTVTGLLGVVVQAFVAAPILTRFGLSTTVGTLPLTVLAGGGWVLAFFGFVSMTIVRGIEVILRGSLFRSGYEVFYTPVPSEEKRAVKAIIDVTGERLGDFVGSGIIGALLLLGLAGNASILGCSIAFSIVGLVLAKRLEGSYAGALETSLRKQAVRLAPEPARDDFGASVILEPPPKILESPVEIHHHSMVQRDPLLLQLTELRSDDEACVIRALSRIEDPHPLILHQLIQFLGNDRYAFFVMDHLRRAVTDHVGQFVDTLLDPDVGFGVRKRIPLILAGTDSQRALDQLLFALSDQEFLIRFRCAHAMSQIHTNHPELCLSQERVWQILTLELQVSLDIWQQRHLLEQPPDPELDSEEQLEKPGDASLEYLFVLLGLVLPRQPVLMAFRALQTDDRHLRGTALEYLQTVLPGHAWKSLEGLIPDRTVGAHPAKPRAAGGR
jgi:ATP:ADP antiporter, AAA family